jgi:sugar transferase (PEP-CTERM/EpsH1 system associated)
MKLPALLYLAHRIPYPPNKGDKLRSFNLLRHLARTHRVYLGCFVDDPVDFARAPELNEWCEQCCCLPLSPRLRRFASLSGLARNEALTLSYYRSREMAAWVARTVSVQRPAQAVVFSSAMAQYLAPHPQLLSVVDFCDVDSAKWAEYATAHRGPLSWLYRREARRLLAYETSVARSVAAVSFVSEAEADLFRALSPDVAAKAYAVDNGVDADFFTGDSDGPAPFPEGEIHLVFTGAMDYWPNIDAVRWFVREVWPDLAASIPELRFTIVGMNPAHEVRALQADPRIQVTGTVADVRPYLRHAEVVVAPLRIARGVQNKVLEAMACARPVVASAAAALGIDAADGEHFVIAREAADFVTAIRRLIAYPEHARLLGRAARSRVLERFSWEANLSRIDPLLERPDA